MKITIVLDHCHSVGIGPNIMASVNAADILYSPLLVVMGTGMTNLITATENSHIGYFKHSAMGKQRGKEPLTGSWYPEDTYQ